MIRTYVGIFSVLGLLACSSDAPPGASTAKDVNLTDSPLARLSKVSLLRAGSSFTLAGYDSETGLVRWGRLTVDGVLSEQAPFALPATLVGPAPVFAATKRTTPGDQLVAIALTTSTTAAAYDLVAVVETVDALAPAAPVVLATLKAGTDPSTVQLAAGAATSGNLGFVAWGTRVAGADVQFLVLPAEAVTSSAPGAFFNVAPAAIPSWDCLQTTNGSTGLGFSVVTPGSGAAQTSDFQAMEIKESGDPSVMVYPLSQAVANCRIVAAPGPNDSYVMVFDTSRGIDAALYSPPAKSSLDSGASGSGYVTPIDPLMANATFGGPLDKPIPAWVSSPGGDISIGLQRNGAPQVVRFTYDGAPHGSALTLRSEHGQTGPIASWVGTDSVYVTYTDAAKGADAATTTKRYFMRIDSPATLP
jgi:hypothetical protein